MDPILLTIGNFEIKWYSVLILAGMIIGYFGVMLETGKFKIDKNFIINIIFWTVIFGIIGARLYYVIFNWEFYGHNLSEIYKTWNGGLAIHGGILLGGLTVFIYCRKYKFSAGKVLDIFAPFILLAQAIGRWGNFFNSEAHGGITSYEQLKNLYIIPEFVIKGMKIEGFYYLPMFYFESIWCIIGFIVLLFIRRIKTIRNGQIVCLYIMWYSFGRFFIEMYRTDSLLWGNLRVAQAISVVLFIGAYIVLLVKAKSKKEGDLYNESSDKLMY